MKIIILVDNKDWERTKVQQAVNMGVFQCDGHTLKVLFHQGWQTGQHLTVNIVYNNSQLQISAGQYQQTFTVEENEVVGIVISHLGWQHGRGGPSSAFQRVCFGGNQVNDYQRITNMYFQGNWICLLQRPRICLAGTYSGYPIEECIIRDFHVCTLKNLNELEQYLRSLYP